mgnify:CR=1 FL=1
MKKYFLLILILILIGCSSKEVTQENKDYVFDNVDIDSVEVNQNLNQVNQEQIQELPAANSYFLIQIGAFTNEQRAKRFADKSSKMLNEEIIVSFSDKVNLYLVQLEKKFNNKSDAEIVRDNLKLFPEFQDAWIVTINE